MRPWRTPSGPLLSVLVMLAVFAGSLAFTYALSNRSLEATLFAVNQGALASIMDAVEGPLLTLDRMLLALLQDDEVREFIGWLYRSEADRLMRLQRLQARLRAVRFAVPVVHSVYLYSIPAGYVLTDSNSAAVAEFADAGAIELVREAPRQVSLSAVREITVVGNEIVGQRSGVSMVRPYPAGLNAPFASGGIIVNVTVDSIREIVAAMASQAGLLVELAAPDGEAIVPWPEAPREARWDAQVVVSPFTGWTYRAVSPLGPGEARLRAFRRLFAIAAFATLAMALLSVLFLDHLTRRPLASLLQQVVRRLSSLPDAPGTADAARSGKGIEVDLDSALERAELVARQARESIPALRRQFLVEELVSPAPGASEATRAAFGLPFDDGPRIVALVGAYRPPAAPDGDEKPDLAALECEVARRLPGAGWETVVLLDGTLACIAPGAAVPERRELRDAFSAVAKALASPRVALAVGVGAPSGPGREGLRSSYRLALRALEYALLTRGAPVMLSEELPPRLLEPLPLSVERMLREVPSAIRRLDAEQFVEWSVTFFDTLTAETSSPATIRHGVSRFLMSAVGAAERAGVDTVLLDPFAGGDPLREVWQHHASAEFRAILTRAAEALGASLEGARSLAGSRRLGAAIVAFVDASFTRRDISLKLVADRFQVTPAYVSRLFREETGSTFLDYLTAARMEFSLEALREGGGKIREIAARVGYSEVHAFIRAFKRRYGLTPTEHRERCRSAPA